MHSLSDISVFSMNQVTNLDSYCVNALAKEIDYLLAFDTDRLLAGFRENAGLDTGKAVRYPGWESLLIGGHTLGHYLSSVAQAVSNPGVDSKDKEELSKILERLLDGLSECRAHSKGKPNFLFGGALLDPDNVEIQFDNVEHNRTDIFKQSWVPWYTLHKLLAGLLDVYRLCGHKKALENAKGIGDWTYQRAQGWDEETAATVISIEFGGMNDALYELFAATGEDKYAVAAHYFDDVSLYERVLTGGEDILNNLHANTTIPKFIGALNRYRTCDGKVIGDGKVDAKKYLEYAESFWQNVVDNHTYVTGGNSEWEHFGKDKILDSERTNCNCETCNVYNMLKLSRLLFIITGKVKYADYYEKAYINTILSSQNPETGMTTYFQPMSTGYFKVYGERFNKFWCCIGTGMENFTKLNDSIFFKNDEYLIINLYEDAVLEWPERKVTVNMKSDIFNSGRVTVSFDTSHVKTTDFGLALRVPEWSGGRLCLSVGQKTYEYSAENGYVFIDKGISSDAVISISFDLKVKAVSLPDNPSSIAFTYGPYVLSADLGTEDMETSVTGVDVTVPAKKIDRFDKIMLPEGISVNLLIAEPERFIKKETISGKECFRLLLNGLIFTPHYLRYKERYGIYFVYTEI